MSKEDKQETIKRDDKKPTVKWKPVSNIKGLDPYENAPESVKQYHENYVKFWNLRTKDR